MSLFTTKAEMVKLFVAKATEAGLIEHMNPDKRAIVETFVADDDASTAVAAALKAYYLQVAPLKKTFDRTHALVVSILNLLQGWSNDVGNRAEVEAETGDWHVGEDEVEDAARLAKFQAGFVKFYGAAGLSPGLRTEAVHKQLKEHQKAHDAMPKTTPQQVQAGAQAGQRSLSAECHAAFIAYHDFLDGYFGKTGQEAFNKKKAFGYDRRSGYYHSNTGPTPKPEPTPPVPPEPVDDPVVDPDAATSDGQPAAPPTVSAQANPVVTGAGRPTKKTGKAAKPKPPAAKKSEKRSKR